MSDWQNSELTEAPPTIKASHLRDGSSITLEFGDDGQMIETQYGPAVSFAVAKVVETNDCDEELDNVLQTAEDSEDGLTLLTSSRRLLGMLDQCKQDSGTLEGNTYEITRFGTEENTQFQIEQQ